MHLALARAGGQLGAVLRPVAVPQRVGGGRGAGVGPAVSDEAARDFARGILGAARGFPLVARRVGTPPRVGAQLRGRVLRLLVPRGRGERRWLLPFVLQHEALRRTLGVHRDGAALAHLCGLLRRRLTAGE